MIRRPPRSTLLTHSFPTRRSSDLFRLSFTRQMPDRQQQEGTDGGEVAYNLLRAGVAQAMPHLENAEGAALHAWSLVHGLAMLVLDRRIAWDEALVEQVVGMTFGGVD